MSSISKTIRTITLEEHYSTRTFMQDQMRGLPAQAGQSDPQALASHAKLVERLCDLGQNRIAEMDEACIDMQVLSLSTPGVQQLEGAEAVKAAQDSNDHLADSVRHYPTRLSGFASLPTSVPGKAADELERAVKEYGFKGAVINGHSQGRYLDDKFFWPILERAESLKVPIYLHPAPPPETVTRSYYVGNFAQEVTALLSTAGWGWHIETAVHVLRLILSGAFDKYPGLQLVIGHLGEALPFMLPRIESAIPVRTTKLNHPLGDYLRENIHYTFSGFNYLPAFLDLLLQVGVDRIMFSVDYPFGSMTQARSFLEQLPVSPADRDRIAHRNAERLLRL
jgi:predicted TIM-barrel fold metal-dependent hydrolase